MADTKPLPLCRHLAAAGLWRYPSLWSNTELRRLGCQIQNIDPDYAEHNKDHNWVGNAPCSRLAASRRPSLAEMFAIHPHHPTRLECLTDILAWGPSWEKGPFPNLREGRPFFFQNVKIRRDSADTPVDYKIFSHRKHIKAHLAEDPPRAIGYLNYVELWKFRGLQYQSRRRRSVDKVLDKDSGPYTPLSWRKDPFLFFILLGIAQTHRLQYNGASSNETLTPRLLVHNWLNDPNHIYLYEVRLDTALIDALIHPGKTITAFKRFNIVWKRISLRPYESFPRRLQSILLSGSIGARFLDTIEGGIQQPPIPDPTETTIKSTRKRWEPDTPQPRTSQTKRKRKSTEDAETSEDDESWKGKRRRPRGTVERPVPYQTRFKAKFQKGISAADSEDSSEETPEIKDPVSARTRSIMSKSQTNSTKDKLRSKKKKKKKE
ncbi:hypothetical protein N7481_010106 [Penicillium waksmanii]|uniref:uncharacterized protein n=1 Tax=Penicillium waksmanii TaxID=69791 RepID=UPI002546CC72|nr:uncharacterized protein N7481_010106 [Penicillium waksmanii]KAJ5976399.1 hypothetical protein N7481_010106 [Penicillium waksmanii]